MSEFTKQEKLKFSQCCEEVSINLLRAREIVDLYKKSDSSFDFLFFLERIVIAAEAGGKSFARSHTAMTAELGISRSLGKKSERHFRDYVFRGNIPVPEQAGQYLLSAPYQMPVIENLAFNFAGEEIGDEFEDPDAEIDIPF